ncbi:hypothetical protein [Prevotella sp. KH2C16]|uniref:hypothetical protein n=1 Tax=Prevotella sp. KH2C16 TaxID=1855325 RepID=UPI0008DEFCB3|nr:hypothetical protein [Prevotella sp. KH2C16]SFG03581.1 hypothetical protein SAMN05216383_10439 [Prevotella sp. KH2C16]
MKKKNLFCPLMALAMMVLTVSFTSCDNDDTKKNEQLTNKTILGTWEKIGATGTLTNLGDSKKPAYLVEWTFENEATTIKVDNKPLKEAPKDVMEYLNSLEQDCDRIQFVEGNKVNRQIFKDEKWTNGEMGASYSYNEKNGQLTIEYPGKKFEGTVASFAQMVMSIRTKNMQKDKNWSLPEYVFAYKRMK